MNLDQHVKSLRRFRKFHKWIGLIIALIVVVSSITGILLAWKKNVDVIQPPTQKGITKNIEDWQSMAAIAKIAQDTIGSIATDLSISKMDARPTKGVVKVIFDKDWEVQVDAKSGEVMSIAKRHSDWIERLHDGSIISDLFKLISMNILGIGLLISVVSGLWLYYGPKRIRTLKKQR